MKSTKIFVILLILALVNFNGCATKEYPKDVVAVVNGKTITESDIQREITERKMAIELSNVIRSVVEPGSLTPKEALTKALNITENDLTPEQIRYIESIERSTSKMLNNNDAFNILLRKEVLYQEALKNGYEVTVDKVKQILLENKKMTNEMLRNNKEAQQRQNMVLESGKKIYKQYGFQSEEDYLNQHIDKTAQASTIDGMKNQFNKVIIDKLPEANGFQVNVEKQNAWDDYDEYLLTKAKVEILNKDYRIKTYGNPWNSGILDLKSK